MEIFLFFDRLRSSPPIDFARSRLTSCRNMSCLKKKIQNGTTSKNRNTLSAVKESQWKKCQYVINSDRANVSEKYNFNLKWQQQQNTIQFEATP